MKKITHFIVITLLGFWIGILFCCFFSTSDFEATNVNSEIFPFAQTARNCNSNLGLDAFWLTKIEKKADTVDLTFQSPINIRYYGFNKNYLFLGIMTLVESSFDVVVIESDGKIECVEE